jgi:hypothetical protein
MTRSSFVALAAVVLAAAAPTAALAGPPKRLTQRVVATGAVVLGATDASTIALETNAGSVLVRNDAGAQVSVAAPAGCTAGAVGGGVIAWDCGDTKTKRGDFWGHVRHMVVTDLAGAVVGTPDVPYSAEMSTSLAVGGQWVEHFERGDNDKGVWLVRTNWHTGEQRFTPDRDASVRPDLDRADLFAPYCAPVRAQATGGDQYGYGPYLRPVQYRAPWAIVDTRMGSQPHNLVHHGLRRCGLERLVTAPASLTMADTAVLGVGWVAWSTRDSTTTLHLLRLSDRRRYIVTARWSSSSPNFNTWRPRPWISFTTGRLWLADGAATVRSVALPRR